MDGNLPILALRVSDGNGLSLSDGVEVAPHVRHRPRFVNDVAVQGV